MQKLRREPLRRTAHLVAALPPIVLGMGMAIPAQFAQAAAADPTEIVVTARRTEEVIQNVPISMTVFSQEMLNERNVTNATDLVAYTPSLNTNKRFGADQASFAIRGFTQDLQTTASVAVYFADVVAPRAGGGTITAGDGAGPGLFFDLQNVQVLKGPQGTLFGRNTTGGAIQLVPQEPTNKLEGYVEVSAGNYAMRRAQGVLNVPVADNVRARFGLDAMRRDGYMNNITDIGPGDFADIDYWSGRGSVVWDITDTVQNYTILTYADSENNGSIEKLTACSADPNTFGPVLCAPSLAAQGDDFYDLQNADIADPVARLKQWQIINTTTWEVNDDLALKNILSFATLKQDMVGSTFGTNFQLPLTQPNGEPWRLLFFPAGHLSGANSSDQSTWVEELQLAGTALDGKLLWQAGYYYEFSRPNSWTGSLSPALLSCFDGALGNDPDSWNCADPASIQAGSSVGSVQRLLHKQEYNNQAVYAQGTYDISDEWRATLGLRYTIDKTHADINNVTWAGFPALAGGTPTESFCSDTGLDAADGCLTRATQRSEAPTWLLGLDYLPTPDVMVYAKYARGYRQGNIASVAPPGLESYDPEEVDAFEIGAKTSFRGPVPGTFNIALFYNELRDQQLQAGFTPIPGEAKGSATTAVANAGASTIQGVEIETTLKLTEDLMFNLGYTYLDTRLDELADPVIPAGWAYIPTAKEGGHLTFSPRHTVVAGLSYRLPLPAEIGDVSAGAAYTFTDSQISAVDSPYGELPVRQLLNLSLGWKAVYGSPFDASLFMTNALDEEYIAYTPGMYNQVGTEFGVVGEPRMWGARVKYNFGF